MKSIILFILLSMSIAVQATEWKTTGEMAVSSQREGDELYAQMNTYIKRFGVDEIAQMAVRQTKDMLPMGDSMMTVTAFTYDKKTKTFTQLSVLADGHKEMIRSMLDKATPQRRKEIANEIGGDYDFLRYIVTDDNCSTPGHRAIIDNGVTYFTEARNTSGDLLFFVESNKKLCEKGN